MHMEIMHVLPLNWLMQESHNLATDIVQGISGRHLAEWSLSVVLKAVQLVKCRCVFSVKPSASNLLLDS